MYTYCFKNKLFSMLRSFDTDRRQQDHVRRMQVSLILQTEQDDK